MHTTYGLDFHIQQKYFIFSEIRLRPAKAVHRVYFLDAQQIQYYWSAD